MPLQENALTTVKDLKAQCGLDEDDTSSDGTLELLINAASDSTFVFQATDTNGGGHTKLTGSSWFPLNTATVDIYI